MTEEIALSLGSNMGDRIACLRRAVSLLEELPETKLLACSPVYETEPVGVSPEFQPLKFLNTVVLFESSLSPAVWLRAAQEIEAKLGRSPGAARNTPRPVDIDIIYVGNQRVAGPDLTVPHPRWAAREFVVRPLADLRPERVLPGMTQSVQQVLAKMDCSGDVVEYTRNWYRDVML